MSKNELALVKKDTVDVVANKVKQFQENGELHFPANYSPENAMKSAWLKLQEVKDKNGKPALEACTKDSIANSLLNMVVQGLNPAKNQGYFIVYGNKLIFQRSYFGTMAVTKRVAEAKSINANVIYEGDEVSYDMVNGRIQNLQHKQKFGNINKDKIEGAYCIIELSEEEVYTELMTMDEIRQAWQQSQMWRKDQKREREGSTHDNFRQEMAKKTVINRACKKFINSSDDGSLLINHFNQTDEAAEEAKAQQEINENANSEYIDIEASEVNEQQEEPKQEAEPEPEPAQEEQTSVDEVMNDMEEKEAVAEGPSF
ncbi:recombination protein RecT [Salinibacillus kushneri]|uniref:Recombination protein RecT n=1 Tax=Salinibacillus kushneri TaxID=237682 RepID=A0A1I0IES5_9BACI|nr:recombinase RecT [Salinibacillus kushneri]SET95400.1 recombination protein RecT [Salinibacillus kushneri]